MDAFELIVAKVLEVEGYWTRIGEKIVLTKQEKKELGTPSMPRPEIDIIAYRPMDNELLIVECKSWLDSFGVRIKSFIKEDSQVYQRFKLFNNEPLRKLLVAKLIQQLRDSKLLPDQKPKIKFVLAAGKIQGGNEAEIQKYFDERGWRFITPSEIAKSVRAWANADYENSVMMIVTKILERHPAKPQ